MSIKKKVKKEEKNQRVVAFLRVSAFLLPLPVYLLFVLFLFPVPNSGFLVLGIVGSISIGLGLMNVAGLYDDNYFGHEVTGISLGVGSLLILVSSVIMYVPAIYAKFDERYVTLYYLVWTALVLCAIWYIFFRHGVQLHLRDQGISKTAIEKTLTGKRNFWWYEAAQKEFHLGWIYHLNKGFTVLFVIVCVVHLLIGWIKAICITASVGACLQCALCAPMWVLSSLSGQHLNKKIRHKSSLIGLLLPVGMCVALVIYLFKYI